MKKIIRKRLSTKCTALLLIMAMLFSVTCVFPFHVYSAASAGTIADGVYTIRNSYLNDNHGTDGIYYLRADHLIGTNYPTPTVQMKIDTTTGITSNLLKYWKVEHISSDVYLIRSMANPNYLLGWTGGVVTLIDTHGTDFPSSVKWIYDNGKLLMNTSNCLTARETPNGGMVNVSVEEITGMTWDIFSFTPVSVTGACWRNENTGNLVTSFSSDMQYIMKKDSLSPDELGYSLVAYKNSAPVSATWSSNNTSVASVGSTTGVVTLKNYGSATITASTTAGSVSYTVLVRMLPDGIYYLRNVQVGLYADAEAPQEGLITNNTPIEQQSFDGDSTKKWNIKYYSSNKYIIQSVENPSLYLGVKNDATANGSEIVLRSGTVTSGMKWTFEKGDQGYKIVNYTASDGTDYVLTANTPNPTNGVNLVLSDHITENPSYQDEWGVISPQHLVMFGIPDVDAKDSDGNRVKHNHNSSLETIHQSGGWSSSLLYLDSTDVNYWKTLVQTCDIYISRSHGNGRYYTGNTEVSRTGIVLNDSEDHIWLYSHYNSSGWESDYGYIDEDYSNVRIALFVGCETGLGGEGARNLPQRIVDLGADVAIGFNETIGCTSANNWTKKFYEQMLRGKTVEEARNKACSESNISKENVVVCGNKNLTLIK